jgi:hypothetical protein
LTAGQNPPYGASINYWLQSAPAGAVKVQVTDRSGQPVRTIDGTQRAGMNRVYWDLRYETSKPVLLRTSPLYAAEVGVGPEGTRPLPEGGGGRMTVLAPPGTYTVKLIVGGQELTQPLTVRKDPNSGGSDADIQTQTATLRDLQKDLETVADMVNTIEVVRSQLVNLIRLTQSGRDADAVKQAADAFEKKLLEIEDKLIQRRYTGQGQDMTRWPAMLASKITYLGGGIAGSDDAPTAQAKEVHQDFKKQIAALQQQLSGVLEKDLTEFNRMLRDRGIQNVIGRLP